MKLCELAYTFSGNAGNNIDRVTPTFRRQKDSPLPNEFCKDRVWCEKSKKGKKQIKLGKELGIDNGNT